MADLNTNDTTVKTPDADIEMNTETNIKPNTTKPSAASRRDLKRKARAERAEVRRLRREYNRRRSMTPVNRRPIVCPPDRAGRDTKTVTLGFICRALVILFAVFGVTYFAVDAFAFNDAGATAGFVFLWSLIFTLLLAVAATSRIGAAVGSLLTAVIALVWLLPDPVTKALNIVTAVWNGAMAHLTEVGYLAMNEKALTEYFSMGQRAGYVRAGVVFFCLAVALAYVPFLIRRVRIIVPALFSAVVLWGVFTYNITRSNWGVVLIIASFSAMLVMAVYDKIYIRRPDPDQYDTDTIVFGAEQGPAMPESVLERERLKREAKEAAKEKRRSAKEKKRLEREKTVTVDEELTDYFSDTSKNRKKNINEKKAGRFAKPKLTPAEKKAAREAKIAERKEKARLAREEKRAVGTVHRFERAVADAKYAMGGFAGVGMMLLAMVLLIIPAVATKENFTTIEAIDDRMEYYRDYVTALLMGDDPVLDELSYEGDINNFLPRSTTATQLHYYGTPLMTVEANYNANVYLRGWIGVDYSYDEGAWLTANSKSEAFKLYRSMFGTGIDPSESMMYEFYSLMEPDAVADRDYVTKYSNNSDIGFVVTQINMKRIGLESKLLNMPSFYLRSYNPIIKTSAGKQVSALRGYGTSEATRLTYVNYYDGIYTSFRAASDTDGYSTVAMVPVMRNSTFYKDVAEYIGNFALLRQTVATDDTDSPARIPLGEGTDKALRYVINLSDGKVINYTVKYDSEARTTTIKVMRATGGEAVYIYDENGKQTSKKMENMPPEYDESGNVVDRYYAAPALDPIIRYYELMTDAEKTAVKNNYRIIDYYTNFVYQTYLKRSGSTVVRDLFRKIMSEATVEKRTVIETETEYEEIITIEPADFSRADDQPTYTYNEKKNTYTLVDPITDSEVYEQRHRLVMEIIKYLTDKDRYTYTLTPKAPATEGIDGVETFLNDTHEGYCVQFASSLVLMLREAGIPARYVEGYIAADFNRSYGTSAAARYVTTVRDWNAHAWVEVWYDGIGWMQYEATPIYYSDMYETAQGTGSNVRPWYEEDEEVPEEEDPYIGLTDEEIAELIRQQEEAERRARIMKTIRIVLIIAAVLALAVLVFGIMTRRARRAAKEREALMDLLASATKRDAKQPTNDEVRRAADLVSLLLAECGSAPAKGEFRPDYATRIADEYHAILSSALPEEKLTEYEASCSAMEENTVSAMFDGIASEEFGYGAPTAVLPLIPRFYRRLYRGEYVRRVNIFRRLRLWLFRRAL